MIKVTKLNGAELYINCELIEYVEATPDTTITMTTGRKVIAKEPVGKVVDDIIAYKRTIQFVNKFNDKTDAEG